MNRLNKNRLIGIVIFLLLLCSSGAYMFFRTKPLLEPDELNADNIIEQLDKPDILKNAATVNKAIAGIEASILQVSQKKQRGLWFVLAYFTPCSFTQKERIIKHCKKEIACWPEGTNNQPVFDCYRKIALIHEEEQRFAEAEKYRLICLKMRPEDSYCWSDYFRLLIKQKKYHEAMRAIEKSLQRENLSGVDFGSVFESFIAMEKVDDGIAIAIPLIECHYEKYPDTGPSLWYYLGKECLGVGKTDLAINLYQKGLKTAQSVPSKYMEAEILFDLGVIYEKQDNFRKAEHYFSAAFSVDSSYKSYLKQIEYLKKNKKYTPAIGLDMLKNAANNGIPECQRLLAQMYEKGIIVKKDLYQAYKWYKKAGNNGDNLASEWLAKHPSAQSDKIK